MVILTRLLSVVTLAPTLPVDNAHAKNWRMERAAEITFMSSMDEGIIHEEHREKFEAFCTAVTVIHRDLEPDLKDTSQIEKWTVVPLLNVEPTRHDVVGVGTAPTQSAPTQSAPTQSETQNASPTAEHRLHPTVSARHMRCRYWSLLWTAGRFLRLVC
jgi:hypothetical protein